MNILKSIGAVFAGLVFIFITHSGVDLILESLRIFTPPSERFDTPWMVVTATIYRTLLSITGCFLTGILAPSRPMLHSLILGFVGLALTRPVRTSPISEWFHRRIADHTRGAIFGYEGNFRAETGTHFI